VVAFAKLADAGQTVASIAARFGVSERTVEQRLSLGHVAPELLDAYRAGEIDLAPWISHQATPENIVPEFPTWLDPATGVIKAMLSFE